MPISTPRERRDVFASNLKKLIGDVSISQACRELEVNRSQFTRYLAGTSTPNPDILARICAFFHTDARVLLEPLEDFQKEGAGQALFPQSLYNALKVPVSHSTLPDGLYAEWKLSVRFPGQVTFHMMRIFTENGNRFTRVKCASPLLAGTPSWNGARKAGLDFLGTIRSQLNGFIILDGAEGSPLVAFASFRGGYILNTNIYPGVRVCGNSYIQEMMNVSQPVFLERIPSSTKNILAMARTKNLSPLADSPDYVQAVLRDISTGSFMSEANKLWPKT